MSSAASSIFTRPGSAGFRTGFAVSGKSGSGRRRERGGGIRSRRRRSAQSRRERIRLQRLDSGNVGDVATAVGEHGRTQPASEAARRARRSAETDTCCRAQTKFAASPQVKGLIQRHAHHRVEGFPASHHCIENVDFVSRQRTRSNRPRRCAVRMEVPGFRFKNTLPPR